MKKHKYWGKIEEDWAGFSAEIVFNSQYFDNNKVTIFLGSEFDDDGEEIETIPNEVELNNFKNTYVKFITNIDTIIDKIMNKTFERYLKLYAHYYENEEKSGEKPLNIDSKEKHFEKVKNIIYIRILDNGNIKILIRYELDIEHGLEIRLENNKIIAIGGIAET
ncbi:hypothetical protein IWQ47_002305 [Aquimarina sp. EL_43]|uniref:DUF6985 domain-containing protein n=1 Tax=unclassified Aquimarina TaxID=2627091 RepID=UPI0018CADBED|nr:MULTISPECIES: hypothetical protein [unclassified Aquimarina]MBG6130841.1 hypothetical protein [Aquimarina sp. EL_35]MBG6151012.1 hypothetical protein [Aquimarina sp. EL_32]MBG6169231.1 hypothetical protein [Aquimarina sp. EL_43]